MNQTATDERIDERIYDTISASFARRLFAWLVDELVLGILAGIFLGVLIFGEYLTYSEIVHAYPDEIVPSIILLNVVYFTALEGRLGQSFGKRVLGIIVFDEKGSRISFTSAFLRRLGMVTPIIIVDGPAVMATSKNQRIFDIIAGTLILEEEHLSDAVKFLREGKTTDRLKESGIPEKSRGLNKKKKRKMLERLKKAKSKLKKRFEKDKLEEEQYLRLKRKYETRIKDLKKELAE